MNRREILFRGKRADNGEWVYGPLLNNRTAMEGSAYIIPFFVDSSNFDYIEVDPSTVGQFTGLLDKNGDKIWEGDLLRCEIGDNDLLGRLSVKNPIDHVIGTICYIDKIGRFTIEVRSNPLDIVGIEIGWGREQFEVIGTIHDTHLTQQS